MLAWAGVEHMGASCYKTHQPTSPNDQGSPDKQESGYSNPVFGGLYHDKRRWQLWAAHRLQPRTQESFAMPTRASSSTLRVEPHTPSRAVQ